MKISLQPLLAWRMRVWVNTTLAQRNAVIAFTSAAEKCSTLLVLMGTDGCMQHPRMNAQHTHKITCIFKDARIQEDIFQFCLCNTQRQMKESVTGKEVQYKLFGFNIKGDREIPISRMCLMGIHSSFPRSRCLKRRAY